MTIYPALGTQKKKIEELRSCEGCHLTVMAKGDWSGWKGVDDGTGKLLWYCDKLPCRQMRDEFIAKRSAELAADQIRERAVAVENAELKVLRKRVGELEAERIGSIRPPSPSVPPVGVHSLSDIMATAAKRDGLPLVVAGSDIPPLLADPPLLAAPEESVGEIHIFNKAGTGALCGGTGQVMRQNELTWKQTPCAACTAKWQAIAEGRERDNSQPPLAAPASLPPLSLTARSSDGMKTYRVSRDTAGEWRCECSGYVHRKACRHIDEAVVANAPPPAPPASAADALYGERPPAPPPPTAPRVESMTRFSPAFIKRAAETPAEFIGKVILLPPEAYPEMDLKSIDPEKMRSGISALLTESGLVIDRIEHAKKAGEVIGIVFTLRRA